MPASRSRTERWKDSLRQICQRGSGIELTIARGDGPDGVGEPDWPDATASDLLWRVRLYDMNEDELVVEQPAAAGGVVQFSPGLPMIGVMAVGQNRWMFHTEVIGDRAQQDGRGRSVPALRIKMPTGVERCQRRSFYRISTAALKLPEARCWPIMKQSTVAAAEAANRAIVRSARDGRVATDGELAENELVLPEVGADFPGRVVNISGGGLGILVDRENAAAVQQLRAYWLTLDLRPGVPAPLGLSAKIVHTHIDSSMNVYCGLAFEFGLDSAHRDFVVSEMAGYVASVQRDRLTQVRKAA